MVNGAARGTKREQRFRLNETMAQNRIVPQSGRLFDGQSARSVRLNQCDVECARGALAGLRHRRSIEQ